MKTSEIRELTTKEIEERVDAESTTLLKLQMNHAVSPLDNPMKIKKTRRDIARMVTELRARQLSEKKK
jgi:large subunit ribosomal protein L29